MPKHADDSPEVPRRATIKDVAALAGVSISTVSHAFSRARPISDETNERVRQAAEALGYLPNPAAAHLRGSQLGLLGLILRPRNAVYGSLGGTETFTRFSGSAAAAALATGRGLLHLPDPTLPRARQFQMDGCIVMGPYRDDEVIDWLDSHHIPRVCADVDPSRPDDEWSLRVSYEEPIRQMARAVTAPSATLIVGEEANNWTMSTVATMEAWALESRTRLDVRRLFEGDKQEGAHAIAVDVLREAKGRHAIFASSSRFARGAYEAAASLGLAVPDEVEIVCFTDSALTREAGRPITGLDLRLEEQAQRCVDLLLDRIALKPAPRTQPVVTPEPKWRQSTMS